MAERLRLRVAGDDSPAPTPATTTPAAPVTLADTGLGSDLVLQVIAKLLYPGEATGTQLAERIRLPWGIIERLVEEMRAELLLEVRGVAGTGTAAYRYALTDAGRERARQFLDVNQYAGPAPVPLDQYVRQVRSMGADRPPITRDRIRAAFSHLVLGPKMLDQLGPAVNSGKSVFLYGPPGNGKTVVAEGLGHALGGDIFIPHAIEVDGQIITMFDPVNHEAVDESGFADLTPRLTAVAQDRRWVRVRRPIVTVGGELTLEMLDLTFNPISRFYEAPIQLKATGGVFVVDDFGRQRIRPRDLLNRWIVPLESRVDYLTLHTGKKFEVPFDVLIVFATNLDPASLADEAFLRRIPYKIYANNPTFDEFSRIFEMNCRRRGLAFDPVIVEYLQRRYYKPRGLEMRACHPRDLVEQVMDLIRYQNRACALTRDLLDTACASFFLEEDERPALVEAKDAE